MQLTKTVSGQSAFKERSPLFSARQRSIFILFDGKKTVEQVLAATAGMGSEQADVSHMLAHGFLALVEPTATTPAALAPSAAPAATAAAEPSAPNTLSSQERFLQGRVLATQLTASLGLRGFRLNLSVESAADYEDLVSLLPKIRDSVGTKACQDLERILKD